MECSELLKLKTKVPNSKSLEAPSDEADIEGRVWKTSPELATDRANAGGELLGNEVNTSSFPATDSEGEL